MAGLSLALKVIPAALGADPAGALVAVGEAQVTIGCSAEQLVLVQDGAVDQVRTGGQG